MDDVVVCNHDVKDFFSYDIWKIIVKFLVEDKFCSDTINFFNGRYEMIDDRFSLMARLDIKCLLTKHGKKLIDEFYNKNYEGYEPFNSTFSNTYSNIIPEEEDFNLFHPNILVDYNEKTFIDACRYGSKNVVEYILKKKYNADVKFICDNCINSIDFVRTNSIRSVKNCLNNIDVSILNEALYSALENGHLEIAKLLLNKLRYYDIYAVVAGAKSGKIEIIELLKNFHHNEIFPWYKEKIMDGMNSDILIEAVKLNNLDFFKYLTKGRDFIECADDIFRSASASGSFEILQYLKSINKIPKSKERDNDLASAIENGHDDVFNLLYDVKIAPCTNPMMLINAGYNDNLNIFSNLRSPFSGAGEISYTGYHFTSNYFLNSIISNKAYSIINYILEEGILKFNNVIENMLDISNEKKNINNAINDFMLMDIFIKYPEYKAIIANNVHKIFYFAVISLNEDMILWLFDNFINDLQNKTDLINKYQENENNIQLNDLANITSSDIYRVHNELYQPSSIHGILIMNKLFSQSFNIRQILPKIEYVSKDVSMAFVALYIKDPIFLRNKATPDFIKSFPEVENVLNQRTENMLSREDELLVNRKKELYSYHRPKNNIRSLRELPNLCKIEDISRYRDNELTNALKLTIGPPLIK